MVILFVIVHLLQIAHGTAHSHHEDDIHLSQLIAAYLTKHGYQVSQHGRGDTAADVILDTRPDLVILDVMLARKALMSAAKCGCAITVGFSS
jgi:response regulator RpfG family c-di-GMP phosphodiesterase